MKKLLLPIILAVVGTGGGVGAALVLKPEPEPEEAAETVACLPGEQHDGLDAHEEAPLPAAAATDEAEVEYAELENQFVVPVVSGEEIAAMVVISLSVEVPIGTVETVYLAEPKLRDAFLQDMFNHANIGGFSGNFTTTNNMRILRTELLASARKVIGETARDILIIDMVRQDI